MRSVLFVCLGNICRSPLAEGIAKKIIQEKDLAIIVDSAGTGDWHIGEHPCPNSIKVAAKYGVDISLLVARQVQKEDIEKFDMIVAMDEQNAQDLKRMGAKNVVKLGDYGYNGADVPDPYFFHGFEGFEKVYHMIASCVEEFLNVKGSQK